MDPCGVSTLRHLYASSHRIVCHLVYKISSAAAPQLTPGVCSAGRHFVCHENRRTTSPPLDWRRGHRPSGEPMICLFHELAAKSPICHCFWSFRLDGWLAVGGPSVPDCCARPAEDWLIAPATHLALISRLFSRMLHTIYRAPVVSFSTDTLSCQQIVFLSPINVIATGYKACVIFSIQLCFCCRL